MGNSYEEKMQNSLISVVKKAEEDDPKLAELKSNRRLAKTKEEMIKADIAIAEYLGHASKSNIENIYRLYE